MHHIHDTESHFKCNFLTIFLFEWDAGKPGDKDKKVHGQQAN